ncbi:MAG: hypothetical protein R3E86_14620 [Pseudomonadales bacterium]
MPWQGHVIQMHPGERAALLVRGSKLGSGIELRALRYQPSSAAMRRGAIPSFPTTELRAAPGDMTRQGQWIALTSASNAAPGLYWLENAVRRDGLAGKVLPVIVEIVPPRQRLTRNAPLPQIPAESRISIDRANMTALSPVAPRYAADPRSKIPMAETRTPTATRQVATSLSTRALAQVAVLPVAGRSEQLYDPACDLNSAVMQVVLDRGGSLPCSGGVFTSGPSATTYLLSHSPVQVATAGTLLTVIAANLTSPQNVRVSLAGQTLPIVSATESQVVARLPDQAVTGPLMVDRTTSEVLGVLNDSYQVTAPAAAVPALFADFTGTRTSVSWKLGYQMSMLSWLAYFDGLGAYLANNPNVADRLGIRVRSEFDETRYGFDVCHAASGSMQGVVFEHGASNTVVVAIRGSQTGNALWDWWDNDLDPQPFTRVGWAAFNSVHCGFHQAARVVYDSLIGTLKDDAAAGRRIWVTGHSLGGASAMLLAAMLKWDAGIPVAGVYTFGAPGIGNAVFIGAYDQDIPNTHRFELQLDPAASMFFPAHGRPGHNHLLHANGSFSLNANQGYLAYPGVTPISDLIGTHMNYWCRIYQELDQASGGSVDGVFLAPPANPDGSGVCEI